MVRFVLLGPRIAENVGGAARVLKNFGWTDWAVVRPEFEDWEPARRMAVQSNDVLSGARRPAELSEAVSDCVWVVGTTSRRRRGQRHLAPRDFAAEAARRMAQGPVALVFGCERSGITNDVLDQCHDVSTIPTDEAQPSINLAQAVGLYAYELRLAVEAALPRPQGALPQAATSELLDSLQSHLGEVLRRGGLLRDSRESALVELMAPLVRSRLTRKEAQLWMAALGTLSRNLPS